ncbi:hypothetical protein BC629DRAFT_1442717 [Irpex lacteus]|nr:hypothetical protein BC629DRAFT_1442717 [Irpex lacteus]
MATSTCSRKSASTIQVNSSLPVSPILHDTANERKLRTLLLVGLRKEHINHLVKFEFSHTHATYVPMAFISHVPDLQPLSSGDLDARGRGGSLSSSVLHVQSIMRIATRECPDARMSTSRQSTDGVCGFYGTVRASCILLYRHQHQRPTWFGVASLTRVRVNDPFATTTRPTGSSEEDWGLAQNRATVSASIGLTTLFSMILSVPAERAAKEYTGLQRYDRLRRQPGPTVPIATSVFQETCTQCTCRRLLEIAREQDGCARIPVGVRVMRSEPGKETLTFISTTPEARGLLKDESIVESQRGSHGGLLAGKC